MSEIPTFNWKTNFTGPKKKVSGILVYCFTAKRRGLFILYQPCLFLHMSLWTMDMQTVFHVSVDPVSLSLQSVYSITSGNNKISGYSKVTSIIIFMLRQSLLSLYLIHAAYRDIVEKIQRQAARIFKFSEISSTGDIRWAREIFLWSANAGVYTYFKWVISFSSWLVRVS
jgi:hypothetical protein